MSQFVKKASSKIEKLSNEEILRILESQNYDIKLRSAILDQSSEAFILVNSALRVVYLNKLSSEILPLSKVKRYKDIGIAKIIMNAELLCFMQDFCASDKDASNEFFDIDDPVSGQRSLNCQAIRLSEPAQYFLFIFRDITSFKRFKEEFRKNESLASMTTMAAGVAHEIKNPLASISIYLQLLQRMWDKKESVTREEASKCLNVISEEVERINAIAVDFLYAVKPLKVSLKSCSMNDIARKTIDLVQEELKDKGVSLNVHLASSLPKVFADSARIEQSILNLINNAVQAMDGCEKKILTLCTFIESDMVKLSVSDTGCGMTDDQMSKVFEPYYTTKSTGTGLGLTVLYKIIKQHGGDVSVRSAVGKGSEFTLQIPVPQAERFKLEG